jgi:hypothetical protein
MQNSRNFIVMQANSAAVNVKKDLKPEDIGCMHNIDENNHTGDETQVYNKRISSINAPEKKRESEI